MYKNSSTPLNNTTLWDYLGTTHLDFGVKIIVPQGVLIKKI